MGFSRFRVPEYLYQTTTGLFIFRMKVPLDCRSVVCQRELQCSLKTHCIYSARKHLAAILSFTHGLFEGIRQGAYDGLPHPELIRIMKEGIKQNLVDHTVTFRQPQATLNKGMVLSGHSRVTQRKTNAILSQM